ncbi:MAG: hypothetical protein AAB364_00335 [Patescibacteria group bacterium]
MMKQEQTQRGFIFPLVIVIVAALAIGGGVYYSKQKQNANPASTETATTETTTTTETSTATSNTSDGTNVSNNGTNGTLRQLLALSGDWTCTVENKTPGAESTGTVYLSGQMMRGDFMLQNQATSEAHMIKTGNDMYVWNGAQGAKMSMDMTTQAGNTQTKSNNSVDLDQKVDYQCQSWTKDESKFAVPSGVSFIDLAAMLKLKAY